MGELGQAPECRCNRTPNPNPNPNPSPNLNQSAAAIALLQPHISAHLGTRGSGPTDGPERAGGLVGSEAGAAGAAMGSGEPGALLTLLAILAYDLVLLLAQLFHQVVGLVHQPVGVGLPRLHLTG